MEDKENKAALKDSLVDVDRTDNGRFLLDDGDISREKNLEEFYETSNIPKESKDIRKCLVATDKIIDKEL